MSSEEQKVPVKAETHPDPAVFDRLADEWNSLLDPTRPEALFLRAEWQRLWWQCLGRGDLNVVTVRDDAGRLVGVAPLLLEETDAGRTLTTIGCVDVADYLDLIYAPQHTQAVLEALVAYLDSDKAPAWDALQLCSLPEGSPTLAVIPRLAQARGWETLRRIQDVIPIISLPGDYDSYLASLAKKQRHEMRRKQRRAEDWEGGVDWYTVGPEHDLDAEINAFLDLMAMSNPEKAYFLEERGYRSYLQALGAMAARQGWLNLQFLRVGGERAAGLFNLVAGDRLMVYNSGSNYADYGPISPGWVLFGYSIADAIARGMACYDFLRGDEDYKYRLGGKDTLVYDVIVHRS